MNNSNLIQNPHSFSFSIKFCQSRKVKLKVKTEHVLTGDLLFFFFNVNSKFIDKRDYLFDNLFYITNACVIKKK